MERGADAENGRDEFWIVQSNAVDDCSTPIVPAEDDRGHAELPSQLSYVVGGSLVGVVGGRVGGVRASVAHHVGDNHTKTQRGKEGDLVSPS